MGKSMSTHTPMGFRQILAFGLAVGACWASASGSAVAQEDETREHKVFFENDRVTVSGSLTVSQALMIANDSVQKINSVVDNQMGDNTIGAYATFAPFGGGDWTAGALLEVDFFHLRSDEVNELERKHSPRVEVGDAAFWVKHQLYGTLTFGLTGGATDGIGESDLSETEMIGSVNQDDIGGEILLRGANRLSVKTFKPGDTNPVGYFWKDAFDGLDHFGGPSGLAVRWDSARHKGFQVSAAVGDFSIWDASVTYEHEFDAFEVDGGIGYFHETGKALEEFKGDTLLGSLSVLHKDTGLSATLASGDRSFGVKFKRGDGVMMPAKDKKFVYGKLGWKHAFLDASETAFYLEAGRYTDGLGAYVDPAGVAAFTGTPRAGVCAAAGAPCYISRSDGAMIGLGVVQPINSNASVYLGYRKSDLDIGFADRLAVSAAKLPKKSLSSVMFGFTYTF